MPFYAVAYAHVCRYEKADDPAHAILLAFGVREAEDRATVRRLPKSPRSMSKKALREEQRLLAKRHFHRTGSVLGGWEREPGIQNVHWTQCPLCFKPITTEPASGEIDEALCQECEPKYMALPIAERNEMSTSKLREKLNIAKHRSPCCV